MDELRTIDDLDVDGQRVLLRADLNVPLTNTSAVRPPDVADDARIHAALATIEELRRRGGRLVVASHLGGPEGHDPRLSMRPVAARLEKLTGDRVPLAPAVVGRDVRRLTEQLLPGEMLMLENLRFELGERRNDPLLAAALAELAEVYVSDAFGSADHAYASTEGVAHLLQSAAGRLIEHELGALMAIVERPQRPLVVILGGAKLRNKIALVRRFLELADVVCVGGGICVPFLAAQGHTAGNAPWGAEDLELARGAMAAAGATRGRLELPQDLILGAACDVKDGNRTRALDGVDVPHGWAALDIGPGTAGRYAAEIAAGATVFWNGPMGRFEFSQFEAGTRRIAGAIALASATTVVAGGHTIQALRSFGLQDHVSHVSTGDGGTLEFLAGRELPGIRVLMRAPVASR